MRKFTNSVWVPLSYPGTRKRCSHRVRYFGWQNNGCQWLTTCQQFVVGVLDMNLVINGLAHHRSIVAGTGLVEGGIGWRSKIQLLMGILIFFFVACTWQGIKIYFFFWLWVSKFVITFKLTKNSYSSFETKLKKNVRGICVWGGYANETKSKTLHFSISYAIFVYDS